MRGNRILLTLISSLVMLVLTGCPNHTSVADVNRDPGHFADKDVTIAGHVSDSFGALGNGIFQIDDGTGQMWVYSQSYGVPANGAKVAVSGRIEQGFSFGGRSFAVILRETSRRH